MKILRAFKTELDLNNIQKTKCMRHAGAARFTYNWGLARKLEAFAKGEKTPSAITLSRELTILKKAEFAWMYEVSKCAPQEALLDLDRAFQHFFRRVRERKGGKNIKVGFPRFKSKKSGPSNFRLKGDIHVFEKAIQLPRLGVLRLKERNYLPIDGVHVLSATVSKKAERWFVSLQVEMEYPEPTQGSKPIVGVDLGIHRMAQVSDGTYFENPRALKHALNKIKHLQRIVTRRQKVSINKQKAIVRLAKAHFHIANIRKNALHKATSFLAKTKSVIVLEDLNISGMLKNHHLAQAIADVGMYEFRRQLQYKGEWFGCKIVFADQFFPSTKRCSNCGNEQDINLNERLYACNVCGQIIDRDLNAAINLEKLLIC